MMLIVPCEDTHMYIGIALLVGGPGQWVNKIRPEKKLIQTNKPELLIRKYSSKIDKFCNVYIING